MDYKSEIVDPTESCGWDSTIQTFKQYSFFHTRAWAGVIKDTYGYVPKYIRIYKNNSLLAILPVFEIKSPTGSKKGVALPFSDHCKFLTSEKIYLEEILKTVFDCAKDLKWKTIEFRGGNEGFVKYPAIAKYNHHIMELSKDGVDLHKRLRDSTWRNIKKAQKKDVAISIDTNKGSMKNYYRLHCQTRKYHGMPPQPYRFFEKIEKNILCNDKGIVVLARKNENIIAGAIFFHVGGYATYKYGASNREYQGLRANNLVMWEAMKYYHKRNYDHLDLGRTEKTNVGLNQFKNGWGTTCNTLSYYRYDVKKDEFVHKKTNKTKRYLTAFSVLPIPVLKLIGKIAYRYIT